MIRVQAPQFVEFRLCRRLGHRDEVRNEQLEPGVLDHSVQGNTRMKALKPHFLCLFVEAHHTQVCDHIAHAAENEPRSAAVFPPVQETGASYEIHLGDEAPLLMDRYKHPPATKPH